MIESTNLKMLRNLEIFQVFSDILTFLRQEESVEEPLKSLCDEFAARLSAYDTALVPERRSPYTAELARLDARRDYVFRSFVAQLKLYLTSYNAEQVKASESLLSIVDKYGKDIPLMPYRQETAAISNLLQDLELGPNVASVGLLFAGHWVEALRTANGEFEDIMVNRSDVASGGESGVSKTARDAVQSAFEKLCAMINALALVNGEAAYKSIIDRINQLVSESRTAVSRRLAMRKSGGKDSTDTPDALEEIRKED